MTRSAAAAVTGEVVGGGARAKFEEIKLGHSNGPRYLLCLHKPTKNGTLWDPLCFGLSVGYCKSGKQACFFGVQRDGN